MQNHSFGRSHNTINPDPLWTCSLECRWQPKLHYTVRNMDSDQNPKTPPTLSDHIADLKRLFKHGRSIRIEKDERQDFEQAHTQEFVAVLMPSGLLILIIAFAWLFAISDTPIEALLLLDLPKPDNTLEPLVYLRNLVQTSDLSTALSLVGFYGLICFLSALIVISGGLLRLLIASNGIWLGLILTSALSHYFVSVPDVIVSTFNIAYLMMAYYLARGLTPLIGGVGYGAEKFAHLFSGLNGLFAGWFLSQGFGAEAVILTGGLFLSCSFLMMITTERVLMPFFFALVALAEEHEIDIGFLHQEQTYSMSSIVLSIDRTWRQDTELCLQLTAVLVGFPVPVGLLVWALT